MIFSNALSWKRRPIVAKWLDINITLEQSRKLPTMLYYTLGWDLTLELSPTLVLTLFVRKKKKWDQRISTGMSLCHQPFSFNPKFSSVCYLQLDTRTWPVAAAVWEMRQFKGESHQLSNKMMMLMRKYVWVWKKEGLGYGGDWKGGRDHSHIRYLHNYLFKRPPTRSRKLVKKKKKHLKMVCFAASTLGLASPKS